MASDIINFTGALEEEGQKEAPKRLKDARKSQIIKIRATIQDLEN